MPHSLVFEPQSTTTSLLNQIGNFSSQFTLDDRQSSTRQDIEALIKQEFYLKHQAEVTHFLPLLLSLRCAGNLSSAIGIQSAAQGALFLEQYLTAPIEQILSAQENRGILRSEILEIGNLVSARSGSSLMLMVALSELIADSPFRWVTFTATPEVLSLLAKLRYNPVFLTQAKPDMLQSAQCWGGYYQKQPKVMAGLALPAILTSRQLPRYQLIAKLIAPQLHLLKPLFNRLTEVEYV